MLMKMRETPAPRRPPLVTESRTERHELPDHDALAALRAWYAGLPTREAVVRYLSHWLTRGQSARRVISEIRRREHGSSGMR